jgi:hypothetical protein
MAQVIGGMGPQFNLAFSLEEAPTFGQGFFTFSSTVVHFHSL